MTMEERRMEARVHAGRAEARAGRLRIRKPADFSPMSEEILHITLAPAFEKMVEQGPDRPAIRSSGRTLTYRELNNAANHIAQQIMDEAGSDDAPTAILLDDPAACLVASLAAVKAGRPYVPLHPGVSEAELGAYLKDAGSSLLVTTAARLATLREDQRPEGRGRILPVEMLHTESSAQNPTCTVSPESPFAIYYTSGSTGQPKGVLVGHLSRAVNAYRRRNGLYISPSDRFGMVMSVWHLAGQVTANAALLSGASMSLLDLRAGAPAEALDWLSREQVTVLVCTPSILRSIFGAAPKGSLFPQLRLVHVGGEPLTNADIELFKAHTAPHCVLLNMFASSEAGEVSDYPIYHDTPPFPGAVPAGFPKSDIEIMILDENGKSVGVGDQGEICVSGPYLNLGYWNNPQLTSRVFRPHPRDPGRRVCHTGDVGRLRRDGVLEILGRVDTQVKVRGFRVQLEAVDLALGGLDGVADAATILDQPAGREPRLVAYLCMQDGHRLSVSNVRRELSTHLPAYSVPSLFIQMSSLPRTGIGKVARKQLPAPESRRPLLDTAYLAPGNEKEMAIAQIWEMVLGLKGVGVQDNFFELGGDSLSVLELTLLVEKKLGLSLPAEFFQEPTIQGMLKLAPGGPSSAAPSPNFELQGPLKAEKPRQTSLGRHDAYARHLKTLASQQSSALEKLKKVGRYVAENRFVDILVARYLLAKPFREALSWAVRWGQKPVVQNLLFPRRRQLFRRFVEHAGGPQPPSSERFGRNIAASMLFSIGHWWDNPISIQGCRTSPRPYYQTLARMLDEIPVGSVDGEFPVTGAEHLIRANAAGKGVILVSMHGAPFLCGSYRIERLLGCEPIQTISYVTPYAQSVHRAGERIGASEHAALLAEIAFFAQSRLRAGGVVNILPDVDEGRGTTGCYSVLGKQYWFKSGLAELALNTGAPVIPYYHTLLPDGCVQTKLEAPLQASGRDREAQIHGLLAGYAQFMEHAYRSDPEAWFWVTMEIQLALPSIDEMGTG
jgi:amino acid adenylation domain-containing protein